MRPAAGVSLTVTRIVTGDPETVFTAWTEPEQLRRWFCPEGSSIALVEVDLRVGGKYRFRIEGNATVHTAIGTYREIARPTRLVYTWDWEEPEYAMGETLVSVQFRAHPRGTEVVLTHERLPSEEAAGHHRDGWRSCLNQLEQLFTLKGL